MDHSDLTESHARQAIKTHRSSSSPSETSSSARMSPSALPQASNGADRAVSNGHSAQRQTSSTDGLRNRDSGSGNGHAKNSVQRNGGNTDASNDQSDLDDSHVAWYTRLAERYGSVELENKGSVARDHLALGVPPRLGFSFSPLPILQSVHSLTSVAARTHVFGVVENLASFCFHWHRSDPALPPERDQRTIFRRILSTVPFSPFTPFL
jgi:hypothetical protein